ncbi:MAG: GtrA family protein [Xanthomonadales bacterium]|nr:GtrA family protein [Xanthomonadales bacterium]
MIRRSRFIRFAIVGTAGFVVDAAVLYALLTLVDAGPLTARIPSFLCAATFTWALNRRWTFAAPREERQLRQWGAYTLAMVCGAAVNYGCYALMVIALPDLPATPLAALAAGSLAGLAVNFALAERVVFVSSRAR